MGGENSDDDGPVISLMTVGPGDAFFTLYGHTAVLVGDGEVEGASLYNYGVYDIRGSSPQSLLFGPLYFRVRRVSGERMVERYERANREVRIAPLNLPLPLRLRMAAIMDEDVKPENSRYQYHHYDDNCATRVRDILDELTGGALRRAAGGEAGQMTIRQHVRRYSPHHWGGDLFALFFPGMESDRPITAWQEMFLPFELERVLAGFSLVRTTDGWELEPLEGAEGQPLLGDSVVVREARGRSGVAPTPVSRHPWALLAGSLLLGVMILPGLWWRRSLVRAGAREACGESEAMAGGAGGAGGDAQVIGDRPLGHRSGLLLMGFNCAVGGLLLGVPGLVLTFMMAATRHDFMYYNLNVLVFSPVALVALGMGGWMIWRALRCGKRGALVLTARGGMVRALKLCWALVGASLGLAVLIWSAGMVWQPLPYQDVSWGLPLVLPVWLAGAISYRILVPPAK